MDHHILVFVPGILGTELYYHGEGSFKKTIREPVWSSDLMTFLKTVKSHSARLRPSNRLEVGDVIRTMTFAGRGNFPIYGDLIDKFFIAELGYREGQNLILFGYDWRAAITHNARHLASVLRSDTRNIDIIAHSMGGLIVRCMLHNPEYSDVRKRVRSVTQIATPVRGSSKAYYTLKKEPQFSRLFDWILKLAYKTDPHCYHQLMASLGKCRSIFDLLPPESEQILVNEIGMHYSALDADVWPDVTQAELDDVRNAHTTVRGCDFPKIHSIYSAGITTDHFYTVDEHFDIVGSGVYGSFRGDGTVIVASAIHGTMLDSGHMIDGKVDHVALPNHRDVWKILKQNLS